MSFRAASKASVVFAFCCVYLCWGMTYGAIHVAVEHIAPPLVGAIRSLISLLIFVGICLARGSSLRVPRRTAWQLALVGVLIMSANNVLLIWAESKVASGWASVVIAMVPVMVAVIETALPRGETLSLRGWVGTVVSSAGILALLWPSLHRISAGGRLGSDRQTLAGFVILALAALAFAAGSVLGRRFHFRLDTFVATAWEIGAAFLVNTMLAVVGGNLRTAQFTRDGVLAILFLAIFGSVVGLSAYTYLLQHVAVTKVSTYAFVNPMIAVLIGAVFFSERLGAAEVGGMLLILFGVAMVILSRTRADGPEENEVTALRAEA